MAARPAKRVGAKLVLGRGVGRQDMARILKSRMGIYMSTSGSIIQILVQIRSRHIFKEKSMGVP